MAFDSRMYLDPARFVLYEAERHPCHGCKWLGKVFDLPFCQHGLIMKFCCKRYKKGEK